MTEFERVSMEFHLNNALMCLKDGKYELAKHNVEQASEILKKTVCDLERGIAEE